MASYPHRVRLHGGRNTHATRPLTSGAHLTACQYHLAPDRNHEMPDHSPVTCPRCLRILTHIGEA